eukprot:6214835-Pleurochrysis_carterae.AAC.3
MAQYSVARWSLGEPAHLRAVEAQLQPLPRVAAHRLSHSPYGDVKHEQLFYSSYSSYQFISLWVDGGKNKLMSECPCQLLRARAECPARSRCALIRGWRYVGTCACLSDSASGVGRLAGEAVTHARLPKQQRGKDRGQGEGPSDEVQPKS